MELPVLPTVNAALNLLAGTLLVCARRTIKRDPTDSACRQRHKTLMLSALGVSAVFLGCYLYYHYQVGSVRYQGTGFLKGVYLVILIPHIILAVGMLPFIAAALITALRGKFEAHRKIVRWAWPIWLYVSVTGVLVYLMLYPLGGSGL